MGAGEQESDPGNTEAGNSASIFILSRSINAKNKHIKLTLTKHNNLIHIPADSIVQENMHTMNRVIILGNSEMIISLLSE